MARILIVEDEAVLRLTFAEFLEVDGYEVSTAVDFDDAVACLDKTAFDVIVSDILLGSKTGIDLLRTIQERALDCLVIMITGEPSVDTATQAVRLGAFDYLAKPVTEFDITRVVRLAMDRRKIIAERDAYRRELDAIFNSVDAGIITVDVNMCVRQINEAARTMFGLGKVDSGYHHFDAVMPEALIAVREALQTTLSSGRAQADLRVEFDVNGINGIQPKIVVFSTTPLLGAQGSEEGGVLIARDITRLTLLEQRLEGKQGFHNIISKSPGMRDIFDLIDDLADTDSTVLISGESGTGKELVAEAIHSSSARSSRPFIKVNCAALSEDILESELFGHVKGAFTGAIKDRKGRFEAANGGTILLDEIGDVSARLQLRLLRVLQEGEFERVGDSNTVKSDVRVIASTNQDLSAKMRAGEFREDLYYRLNVVAIKLPPLRQRREDVPLLVEHFCHLFNTTMKKEISGLSPEALDIMMNCRWPGNIRELENCIERAFVVCHDTTILPEHLPEDILDGTTQSGCTPVVAPGVPISREAMLDVLTQTDWNVAKSARMLGIARNTLYQKMKTNSLSRPQ